MTAAVFAPLRNAPGKRDAFEFLREAHAFNRAHGFNDVVCVFDNDRSLVGRRGEVLGYLRKLPRVSVVAFFCHGWPEGVQTGFMLGHVRLLAGSLASVCGGGELTVALYCCSTGADDDGLETDERAPGPGGDGGFANRLRDELCDLGVRATVFAHSTAGHTTRNPWVRVFRPDRRAGGEWLVTPGGPLWAAWLRALKYTDVRLKFPLVTQAALEQLLTGGLVA